MSDMLELNHKGAVPKDIDGTADEITRLRADNEKLNVALDGYRKDAQNFLVRLDDLNTLRANLAAVTAERDRMREALIRIDGMATTICMKDDAGYGIRAESVMPIYEIARAAIEGVTEPTTGDSNA